MMEISDRTIVVLTVIALITTVSGALTILQKVGPDVPLLSGLATTDTGEVNLTIDAAANIAFVVDTVEFGSGAPDSSSIRPINTTGGFGGGNNPSTFDNPGPLSVRNDGNVDVNVTINGTPADTFLGGTSPTYEFASLAPGTDDGCANNRTHAYPTSLNATQVMFCSNLTFSDSADTTNISILLGIPSDITSGAKQDTAVTIFAIQMG